MKSNSIISIILLFNYFLDQTEDAPAEPSLARQSKRMKSSIEFMLNSSGTQTYFKLIYTSTIFSMEPMHRSDSYSASLSSKSISSHAVSGSPSASSHQLPRLNQVVAMEELVQQQPSRFVDRAFSQPQVPAGFSMQRTGENRIIYPTPVLRRGYSQNSQPIIPVVYSHGGTKSVQQPRLSYPVPLQAKPAHGYGGPMAPYGYTRTHSPPVFERGYSLSGRLSPEAEDSDEKAPKLKYSHKIAERKRRKDMNDTFDELKDSLPSKNMRMSKWEILMSASEHIKSLNKVKEELMLERETLHRALGVPVVELVKAKK